MTVLPYRSRPNPRKLAVYLGEKGIAIPIVRVPVAPRFSNLYRWYVAFKERPSARLEI